jgi:hypothetical protein
MCRRGSSKRPITRNCVHVLALTFRNQGVWALSSSLQETCSIVVAGIPGSFRRPRE